MMRITQVDKKIIAFFRRTFIPFARIALFVVFFWFGILKVFNLSPASPLAESLTTHTVGVQYFTVLFFILSLIECAIGILFLIPKATRVVIPLLFVHMVIVCAPLVLIPGDVWTGFLVPTLEGQYIIKNIVIVAVAVGIASQETPLRAPKKKASNYK